MSSGGSEPALDADDGLPLQKKGRAKGTRASPPARKLLPQNRHLCCTEDHCKSRVGEGLNLIFLISEALF